MHANDNGDNSGIDSPGDGEKLMWSETILESCVLTRSTEETPTITTTSRDYKISDDGDDGGDKDAVIIFPVSYNCVHDYEWALKAAMD